jgi:hypothetical protein
MTWVGPQERPLREPSLIGSTWNFCPFCGHRLYQHGSEGCEHVDIDNTTNPKVIRTPCDCTHPHPLLVKT